MSYVFEGGVETNNVRSLDDTMVTVDVDSRVMVENTTPCVNSSSGALQVAGGIGVGGGVCAAGTLSTASGLNVTAGSVNVSNGVTIDFGNNVVNSVATPIVGTDVANKAYVDSIAAGLNVLQPVVAAAVDGSAPVNLGATLDGVVVDGVTLVAGDRVLVTDQSADGNNPSTTTDVANGIYEVQAGPALAVRSADLLNGSNANDIAVLVQGGSTNSGFVYIQNQNPSITGTDPLLWVQLFQATSQDLQAVLTQGNTTGPNDINVNSTGRITVSSTNTPQIVSLGTQDLSIASATNTDLNLTAQGTGNVTVSGDVATLNGVNSVAVTTTGGVGQVDVSGSSVQFTGFGSNTFLVNDSSDQAFTGFVSTPASLVAAININRGLGLSQILANSNNMGAGNVITFNGAGNAINSSGATNIVIDSTTGTGNLLLSGNNVVIESPNDVINFVTSTQTIGFNPNDNALQTTAQNIVDAINEVQGNAKIVYTFTNIPIRVRGTPSRPIGYIPFDFSDLGSKTATVKLFADFTNATGATLSLDLFDNSGSSLLVSPTTATATGLVTISGITLPSSDTSIELEAQKTAGSGFIRIEGAVVEFN